MDATAHIGIHSIPEPCSVLIVESGRLAADALELMLSSRGWVSRIQTASHLNDALRELRSSAPDLVLVSMMGQASIDCLATLCASDPLRPIIAFAVPDNEEAIIDCAELGVAGLLPLTGTVEDLEDIVSEVLRGETAATPRVAAILLRRVAALATPRYVPSSDERLTPREREVLTLIELGWTNKQIAHDLHIEVRTVKNHVHNLLEKMRVSRRGEAAAKFRLTRVAELEVPHRVAIGSGTPDGGY